MEIQVEVFRVIFFKNQYPSKHSQLKKQTEKKTKKHPPPKKKKPHFIFLTLLISFLWMFLFVWFWILNNSNLLIARAWFKTNNDSLSPPEKGLNIDCTLKST